MTLSSLEKPLILEAREARSAPSPLGQSINLWPAGAGAGADPLHSLTEHRPAPNAWFTLPLLLLQWWCSHHWVMWGVICHFCFTELENLLGLVHLQLLQRGVDALQMRGISFPCSLLHGNLIRFCMTDHRKQQKVWRSFPLEPDKRNTRIKTSREQKVQSWLKDYSTGSNSLLHLWLFNNSDIL